MLLILDTIYNSLTKLLLDTICSIHHPISLMGHEYISIILAFFRGFMIVDSFLLASSLKHEQIARQIFCFFVALLLVPRLHSTHVHCSDELFIFGSWYSQKL